MIRPRSEIIKALEILDWFAMENEKYPWLSPSDFTANIAREKVFELKDAAEVLALYKDIPELSEYRDLLPEWIRIIDEELQRRKRADAAVEQYIA